MIAELAARGTALLGEAPRWMTLAGVGPALHFTDLLSGVVYTLDGDTAGSTLEFPDESVSALIPLESGSAAVALHRDIAIVDSRGTVQSRRELDLPAGTRLSDATAGPSGHVWLGVVPAGDEPTPGMLLRVGDDGTRALRADVGFSNGLGFTADGTALFHIDSASGTVWRTPHDPSRGELGESVELFRWPAEHGALDGLCVDEHDRVWIAVFGGGEVICVDHHGEIAARVMVPARRVTSCVFSGSTLFVTTARVDATAEELAEFPLSGSLFRARMDVSGGAVWKGHLA